jgi:cephalosporin-C deacetylase
MAAGLMDEICPPSTEFAAYNRMTCAKSLVIYPDFAHESLPGVDDMIYEYFAAM